MWNWYCPYFSGAMLQFRVLTFVILYFPSPPKFQKYSIYIFLKSRHSQYGSNVWIYAPIIQTRLIHVNSKLCAMLLQPQLEFGFLGLILCLFGGDLLFAANTQTHDWETQKAYFSRWCFKCCIWPKSQFQWTFHPPLCKHLCFVQTIVQALCANTNIGHCLARSHPLWIIRQKLLHPREVWRVWEKSWTKKILQLHLQSY